VFARAGTLVIMWVMRYFFKLSEKGIKRRMLNHRCVGIVWVYGCMSLRA